MVGSQNSLGESAATPPQLKKSSSSSKQTSIAGFFRKKDAVPTTSGISKSNGSSLPIHVSPRKDTTKKSAKSINQSLTPAPSSDAIDEEKENEEPRLAKLNGSGPSNSLPSPITPANIGRVGDRTVDDVAPKGFYSPSRKVCAA